jgi:hypothetical protein
MPRIKATITVSIDHISGPSVDDPQHVLGWITADGQYFEGGSGYITYTLCPHHPADQQCNCTTTSIYRITIADGDQ